MHRIVVQSLARGVLAAAIAGGCAANNGPAPSADPGAKAGGKAVSIAITVADSQFPGRPSNVPLHELKRLVEAQSDGVMTVEILLNASDDKDPGSDAVVIERVKSGAYEMAVVPARAWSSSGVMTMNALQAPFLFESDGHVAAALRDPTIAGDLLSGLDGAGVTGLTLFPDTLRHLFSFGRPFLTPADVDGRTIQAFASLETTALIEALGGTAVNLHDPEFVQGVGAGTVDGTDSGFTLAARGQPNKWSTATGNVATYAKVISLVVNTEFWDGLSDGQRRILLDAAEATREWAIANQEADADAAASFCAGGGRVMLADPEAVDAFRKAEQPVYAALEADPLTKRSLDAIAAISERGDAAPVAACEPDPPILLPEGGDLPNGRYRVEATEAFLKANYPDYYPNAEGLYTFELDDGRWSFDYVAPNGQTGDDGSHQSGTYRADGSDVQWLWDPAFSVPNPVIDATWAVDPDGTLHFVQLTGPPDWAMALPFARIGDLP